MDAVYRHDGEERGAAETAAASIAVVGGGPRGVAVAARLVADRDIVAPGVPLVVHVIDAVEVGAGRTWRRDQPYELLNNTYCAETTAFADSSVPTVGPADARPSLAEWVRMAGGHAVNADAGVRDRADWIAAEAAASRPWTFPSRRLQGAYYRWALDRVIADTPDDVTFVEHVATVVALDDDGAGRQCLTLRTAVRAHASASADGAVIAGGAPTAAAASTASAASATLVVDAVVLAQGVLTSGDDPDVRRTVRRAAAHGVRYIRPGMPSERPWRDIPAGADVIVTGLGANFFDAIGLLFAGRGGHYERDADGLLRYMPSGAEPHVIAGSRRGLPYRAKAYYAGGLPDPVDLPRFSASRERELMAAHARRHDIVFRDGLAADIRADFRDVFDAVAAREAVAATFDWDDIVFPAARRTFADDAAWQGYLDGYFDDEVFRIHYPDRSPAKAVHRAMETARRRLARLVVAGVFDPVSVVRDLKRGLLPQGLVIASGPPPERLEQLVALRRAGHVEILGPGLSVSIAAGGAVATTAVPGQRRVAGAFAEAHMRLGDLRTCDDPLVAYLIGTGQARFHRVTSVDAGSRGTEVLDTDTLDVTPDGFLLVDAVGRPHDRRVVLGPPAGDVQWYSAIGAVPGTGDKLLVGADRAAAHVLHVAAEAAGAGRAGRRSRAGVAPAWPVGAAGLSTGA